MRTRHEAGIAGEAEAERYLTGLGMVCLARRYRGQDGEIDLVMRDGETVVFVEVKYRPSGASGAGLTAVTPAKRRRIAHAALAFLVEREWMNVPVRFDVVEITRQGVRYVPCAFYAG